MPDHYVLIVEDDEDIRESLMDFLQDHGYESVGAVNGREALEKLGPGHPRPCVIILDLMMPIMDGRAFRRQQLGDPELRAIPVVVISAYQNIDVSVEGLNVTRHMVKPFDLKQLLDVIQEHCPQQP
jgi:CheY-like chemotaxis protein